MSINVSDFARLSIPLRSRVITAFMEKCFFQKTCTFFQYKTQSKVCQYDPENSRKMVKKIADAQQYRKFST